MNKSTSPRDMANFEAAAIRDGADINFVFRRRGPAILTRLKPPSRNAVEVYTTTAEAVMAGGATNPRDSLDSGGGSGGGLSKDGRQAGVVDQVTFLRKMEGAAMSEPVIVNKKPLVAVNPLHLWRRVCLGDVSMQAYLTNHLKLARSQRRMGLLQDTFVTTADRVADAIGATKSPWT